MSTGTDPRSPRELCAAAAQSCRAGEWNAAREHFHEATRLDPSSAEAHLGLGIVLGRLGDLDSSLGAFERVLDIDPHHVVARVNAGTLHNRQGRHEQAIELLRGVLEIAPNRSDVHYQLALALRALGMTGQSIEHSRKAHDLDPRRIEILLQLGCSCLSLDRFEDARNAFTRALELDATSEKARRGLERAERSLEETSLEDTRTDLPAAAGDSCCGLSPANAPDDVLDHVLHPTTDLEYLEGMFDASAELESIDADWLKAVERLYELIQALEHDLTSGKPNRHYKPLLKEIRVALEEFWRAGSASTDKLKEIQQLDEKMQSAAAAAVQSGSEKE